MRVQAFQPKLENYEIRRGRVAPLGARLGSRKLRNKDRAQVLCDALYKRTGITARVVRVIVKPTDEQCVELLAHYTQCICNVYKTSGKTYTMLDQETDISPNSKDET